MGEATPGQTPGVDVVTMQALREQLAALASRVEEQAAELARLKSAPAHGGVPSTAGATASDGKVGRRGMLTQVLGATAAAALLTVAKEGRTASADTRATIINDPSDNYGLLASDGADPISSLPNLNGFFFGAIGTRANSGIPAPYHAGVFGSGGASHGVLALSNTGTGAYAQSNSGVGVIGISSGAAGMYGFSSAQAGVFGSSPNNVGVFGSADNNAGVFGASPVYGVWGRTVGGFGVNGEAAGAGIGVYGKAGPGGFAGFFDGPVFIRGFGVIGSASGSQATTAQAAPAQTVESFGTGKLSGGQATVALDQDFTAAANGADYAVVVTEEGESNGLFVTGKGSKSFTVKEKKGGTSDIPFSYRVAAKDTRAPGRASADQAAPRPNLPKEVPAPAEPKLPERGRQDAR